MVKSGTVMIFAGLDPNGIPKEALVHFGHEAYEHYMVAPYVRELMMVRNSDYLCWSPDFEYLHAAICSLGTVQFEELGSTLFSTIDKIDKLNRRHNASPSISYVGIEISQLLIDLAVGLHPTADLKHFARWQDAPTPPNIVSRSYQSTSYAFQTTDQLFEWVSRAEIGIHVVWFSLDKERQINMIGNKATLFDPRRLPCSPRMPACPSRSPGRKSIRMATTGYRPLGYCARDDPFRMLRTPYAI